MPERFQKGKVVVLCSFSMMVFTILSFISIQQLRESNSIREADENIEKLHGLSLEIFKNDVDFFSYELNESEFFKTGNSIYLRKHDSLLSEMRTLFKKPINSTGDNNRIASVLNSYDSAFDEIVDKIKLRGYRDYGLEGNMRSAAHDIEKRQLIAKADYLTLRRHEKDFLLRSDMMYVKQFDSIMNQLTARAPKTTSDLLVKYSDSFHQLINISDLIGLETQTNLKGNLDRLTLQLISEIKNREVKQDIIIFNTYQKGLLFLVVGIVGSTILSLILILIVARRL